MMRRHASRLLWQCLGSQALSFLRLRESRERKEREGEGSSRPPFYRASPAATSFLHGGQPPRLTDDLSLPPRFPAAKNPLQSSSASHGEAREICERTGRRGKRGKEVIMETLMVDRVQSSLRHFMHGNAIFLCERLCAEFPTELNLQLMATCYLRNNQPYCVYHILKDATITLFVCTIMLPDGSLEGSRSSHVLNHRVQL